MKKHHQLIQRKTWFWTVLASGLCLQFSYTETILPAFFISKDKNKNLVKYDLKVNGDCSLNRDEPFDFYWMSFNDNKFERENMNFIEKHYYGVNLDKTDNQEVKGEVKILKKMNLGMVLTVRLKKNNGKCDVESLVNTKDGEVLLKNIHLQKFDGQKPSELIVIGKNLKSNQDVNLLIDLKKLPRSDD